MNRVFGLILILISFEGFTQNVVRVLASGSWTAAYAKAAGADSIALLASSTMLHPSEYELTIHDMKKISQADLILYGGYEVVISQMKKMLSLDENRYLRIETGYTEETMIASIRQIAQRTHTQEYAEKSIEKIMETFRKTRNEIESEGLKDKPVLVHFYQEAFARELGLNPVGVFGPAPLEVYEIAELVGKKVAMIIDNVHNPVAKPLKEINPGTPLIELVNFPGYAGTTTLESVIRHNLQQITGKNK